MADMTVTLARGRLLAELHRREGRPCFCLELARDLGLHRRKSLENNLLDGVAAGWIRDWWEDPADAAAEKRPRRRYYEITAAGRTALQQALNRFGDELGAVPGMTPSGPPRVRSPRRTPVPCAATDELGRLMRGVKEKSGMTVAEVAALGGRRPPWLSQVMNGKMRRPNVAALRSILEALSAPREVSSRVLTLAESLSAQSKPVQGRAARRAYLFRGAR